MESSTVTAKPRFQAAVLGHPIAHSLSPVLHHAGYQALGMSDWSYTRIDCTEDQLASIVSGADESFLGFSVTMPCKHAALGVADVVSERARLVGAANTLVRTKSGWFADNTDIDGIHGALDQLIAGDRGDRLGNVVLIGGGGTAKAALYALLERDCTSITMLNRTDRRNECIRMIERSDIPVHYRSWSDINLDLINGSDILVSTVPSAVFSGKEGALAHSLLLDVIYDPWPTQLAVACAANGYSSVGGHVMLANQAYRQFELFTGVEHAPRETMFSALMQQIGQS